MGWGWRAMHVSASDWAPSLFWLRFKPILSKATRPYQTRAEGDNVLGTGFLDHDCRSHCGGLRLPRSCSQIGKQMPDHLRSTEPNVGELTAPDLPDPFPTEGNGS